MMRMDTKVIRSEEQHQEYLSEIQRLLAREPQPGSKEAERLELLSVSVEAFENQKYPIEDPDPIGAILFEWKNGVKAGGSCTFFRAPVVEFRRFWQESVH